MNTEKAVNILLVDDRQEDLLALELILANKDYNFVKANSGREALRILLKEYDFALILIDVQMPLLDGFETASLIRESDKLKHIPIIFLTANNDAPADIFKGYVTGAVDFIIKPVAPEIIKAKVSVFADLYKKTFELQRQQKSLIVMNGLYETLLKTESELGQGVVITEGEKAIYVNDAICKICGYTREEILSLPSFLGFLPEEKRSRLTEKIQEPKAVTQQSSGETKFLIKSGHEIDVEYRACTIDVDGRKQLLSIIRDITKEKQDEELLRQQTERAKSAEIARKVGEQFLANMSHEIRTPMNAIVGFAHLMLKTPLSPEQGKYLDAIKKSGDNLLVIINDILDFSRMQSGKIPIEQRPFKLSQIVSMCTELMIVKATEKGVKLHTYVDYNIPNDLIGDPIRLNQVLLNLTANAIKFTSKGEVKIEVKLLAKKNDEVEIEFAVRDTGIGIPQDKIDTIFEAFMQANNDTSRNYGGTGLGLAIVKQLAELQGGSITVCSEEGKGSCFYFRIKYKRTVELISDNSISVSIPIDKIKKLNILLVEDNSMNQLLALKVLSDWGWTTDVVENGNEAIERIKNKDFDVILMDIQMPEMDGYETAHHIRNKLSAPKSAIPIMAMTAHILQSEEEKCYKAGMNGYISKPFDVETLYSKIVSIVAQNN